MYGVNSLRAPLPLPGAEPQGLRDQSGRPGQREEFRGRA